VTTGHPSSVTEESSGTASNEGLKDFVRQYGYGIIMVGCLLVLWWAIESPHPLIITTNVIYITMLFTIAGLEYWIPYTRSWGDIRKATRADVTYFLLAAPIDALQMFLLVTLLASTAQYHHYLQVFHFWPHQWPLLVQLLMATLVVDVFKYWYHRWTHTVGWMWRYHTVHHSLDRLEMLRASYFYPIDIFLTVGLGTLAMLMLGVDHKIIIFHNVYAGITGLMNHSNADLKCGIFDYFVNSIGHHRAHHAVGLPGSMSNYGSFFNFADRMFGTRYLPEDQSSFDPLGLDETYDFPDTVVAQLAVPFRWKQVHKPPQQD
jgi:sterol desaturase/sphingolipid hydroxylase (fatty acid hydroxylase superfamily)